MKNFITEVKFEGKYKRNKRGWRRIKNPHEAEIKMAGYLHRTATTAYPCYLPILGEFSRSWSCKTCRRKDKEEQLKNEDCELKK